MSKTGIVKYYVTTDTHSYPWGIRNGVNGATVHFDLGDNTAGFRKNYAEAPEVMSVASQIALRGNHDTAALGWNKNTKVNGAYALQLQVYRDNTNKIIFFGLDTGTDDVNVLEIPLRQIDQMAQTLSTLPLNWDVVVLTHTPLFPKTVGGDVDWDCGACWGGLSGAYESSVTKLLDLLQKFKKHSSSFSYVASDGKTYSFESSNGYVIGCFAGHIHNHIKCKHAGIPMETFPTNGSDEWTTEAEYKNSGLYVPWESYISINYSYNTVNGMPFDERAFTSYKYDTHHTESNCFYLAKAVGHFQMRPTSAVYAKFYNGTYIGYSGSPLDGTTFGNNTWKDRYWPFGATVTLTVGSSRVSARVIWFDTNGRLRYYSNDTDFNNDVSGKEYWKAAKYTEINQYKTARVTFKANNVTWTFQNGLLVSAVPTYCAGSLAGKNGYAIEFNANGVPTGISRNGSAGQDYGAGQNYVNYKDVKVYQGSELIHITQVPQIGITGRFTSSSKINLARADSNGANRITSPDNLLLRVVDVNDAVWWLYDGKLTILTDQQVL